METRVDEIADGIYRLSTFLPDVAPPAGFTMNQFLIDADEPLLFHTGPRRLFPVVAAAAGRVIDTERLRWVAFGHVEADECGAMNLWLEAAPKAEVAHNAIGNVVSIEDLADRPPRSFEDGEVLELGGKRVRHLDTPHVPHGWEARVLYEQTTETLLCGDLFTQLGDRPPLVSDDLVEGAIAAEAAFGYTSLGPYTAPTMRRLAALEPHTLALMHGPSYTGDGGTQLRALADHYEDLVDKEMAR